MNARILVLLAAPVLAACGGSNDPLTTAAEDAGTGGDAGVVVDNGGSAQFSVVKAYISRDTWCGTPPPFQPGDDFHLVLEGPGQQDPRPRIQIDVWATAPLGASEALTLVPWKPGPAPSPGSNDDPEDAYRQDAHGNDQLGFSLGRGMTPNLPDPNPYDQATLAVLAIPTKEGDTLQVRVQLHFTDGATLDETFVSPPLIEMDTPCAGR